MVAKRATMSAGWPVGFGVLDENLEDGLHVYVFMSFTEEVCELLQLAEEGAGDGVGQHDVEDVEEEELQQRRVLAGRLTVNRQSDLMRSDSLDDASLVPPLLSHTTGCRA